MTPLGYTGVDLLAALIEIVVNLKFGVEHWSITKRLFILDFLEDFEVW